MCQYKHRYSSSGSVDGPLLETHSLLTCRQPRVSQVLSTKWFYPPTSAHPKVYLLLQIGINISLHLATLLGKSLFAGLRLI